MGGSFGRLRHFVDASACKAILLRKGTGTLKHLETKDLWVQEVIRKKQIEVCKVPREENMSDSLASYSNGDTLCRHMEIMKLRRQQPEPDAPEGGCLKRTPF